MTSTSLTIAIETEPLSLAELARAAGAEESWVVRLVEFEILQTTEPGSPAQWRFDSAALQRALTARRLERDFGANLDTAALILDLQSELRRLRALLAAHGVA